MPGSLLVGVAPLLKRISGSLTRFLLSSSAGEMLPMDDNLRVDEDQVWYFPILFCTETSHATLYFAVRLWRDLRDA